MANSYLTKDFGSAGNRKTMTFSFWVKRNHIGANGDQIIGDDQSSYPSHFIMFESTDRLGVRSQTGSSDTRLKFVTERKFKDCQSWYHFVVVIDTTQANAVDRCKIYVNGEQILLMAESDQINGFGQNTDTHFNQGSKTEYIGKYDSSYANFNLAHYHFVDGTAYTPSTFGETDSTTGEWKPKLSPSVTYGTHGFFLKFENAGALGTDSSGNTKTFTVNGNIKQSINTPTNLFATFNPNHSGAGQQNVIGIAGTQIDHANDSYTGKITCATLGMQKGKWYWETKYSTQGGYLSVGFVRNGGLDSTKNIRENKQLADGDDANSWAFRAGNSSGQIVKKLRHNNADANADMGVSPANGDIIQCWLDLDNGKAWWGINGTVMNSGSGVGVPNTGAYPHFTFTVGDEFYIPAVSLYGFNGAPQCQVNFGEGRFGTTAVSSAVADNGGKGSFELSPLAGFYSICTNNLKDYG